MPRKRKPTQPIQTPTNLPYGMGQQLQEAQAVAPLPQPPVASDLVQPGQGTPAGGPPPPPGGGGPPLDAAMAAAQGMTLPPGGLLAQGDPNEPLTAGLPMGPGPGPEVLRTPDRTDLFHELARITGDARFLRMAPRARQTR